MCLDVSDAMIIMSVTPLRSVREEDYRNAATIVIVIWHVGLFSRLYDVGYYFHFDRHNWNAHVEIQFFMRQNMKINLTYF